MAYIKKELLGTALNRAKKRIPAGAGKRSGATAVRRPIPSQIRSIGRFNPLPPMPRVPHGANVSMGAPGGGYRRPPMVNPLPGRFVGGGDNPQWQDPYDTDEGMDEAMGGYPGMPRMPIHGGMMELLRQLMGGQQSGPSPFGGPY